MGGGPTCGLTQTANFLPASSDSLGRNRLQQWMGRRSTEPRTEADAGLSAGDARRGCLPAPRECCRPQCEPHPSRRGAVTTSEVAALWAVTRHTAASECGARRQVDPAFARPTITGGAGWLTLRRRPTLERGVGADGLHSPPGATSTTGRRRGTGRFFGGEPAAGNSPGGNPATPPRSGTTARGIPQAGRQQQIDHQGQTPHRHIPEPAKKISNRVAQLHSMPCGESRPNGIQFHHSLVQ